MSGHVVESTVLSSLSACGEYVMGDSEDAGCSHCNRTGGNRRRAGTASITMAVEWVAGVYCVARGADELAPNYSLNYSALLARRTGGNQPD